MRNRSAIWVFTILLTLACLYQLSLSWFTGDLEDKAKVEASSTLEEIKNSVEVNGDELVILGSDTIVVENGKLTPKQELDIYSYYESSYIAQHADDPVYPVLGLSYRKCKSQQLTKGLDLQGGMSFTLEISIPELVKNKAGFKAEQKPFKDTYDAALDAFGKGQGDDFIELFFEAYEEGPWKDKKMDFFYMGSEGEFTPDMTQTEMKEKLQAMADESIEATKTVIEERVNRFGLGQIVIQSEPLSGRLHIEVPGAKDKQGLRNMLQSRAILQFWNGYNEDLEDSFKMISQKYAGVESVTNIGNGDKEEGQEEVVEEQKTALDYVEDSLLPYLADGYAPQTAEDSAKLMEANFALVKADSILKAEEAFNDGLAEENPNLENTEDVDLNAGATGNMFDGRFTFTQEVYQNELGEKVATPTVGFVTKPSDTVYVGTILRSADAQSLLPDDKVIFMWSSKPESLSADTDEKGFKLYAAYPQDPNFLITGANVVSAGASTSPDGPGMVVNMTFDSKGSDVWENWTSAKVGQYVGISLDNVIYSFPVINGPISGGSTRISGDFSLEEAEELAAVLEAGSLPTSPVIVDEALVGPTLGEANIQKGLWSFAIALVIVLIYMVFYYAKAGIVADIALIANLFFIFGTLASLGAALTLPGIAGLVLTIGMSVDANVLIFERIREELKNGKVLKQAIADGYKAAYSAILDSNITSLLTAIILAYFGSGPIQGFATTLIIGIFSSLFCSIFVTRLLFSHMLDRKMGITFSNSFSNWFSNANFTFMEGRRKYYYFSAAIVAAGVISLFTIGIDKSVEFTGGRTYTIAFSEAPDQDEVATVIEKYSIEQDGQKGVKPVVKTVDGDKQLSISTNYLIGSKLDDKNATAKVDSVMNLAFNELGYYHVDSDEVINQEAPSYSVEGQRSVSAVISNNMMWSSLVAIALSLLVVFIYIGFRFNRWQYGLGALIAMFHDVLVVLGVFSILYALNVPINVELDQAIIAAILTVIGYSINDTVVIFDRIREYIGLHKRDDQNKVINSALNTTLSRTINTSLTTFMVLLIIFLFGGDGISGFSLALLIGVAVGTYSSLFIAAPSVVEFTKNLMPVSQEKKK
ncbi:protein translocase subunit SecD [Parvicella tangerina]|uniref:Multifunctional fusion protein n=1 Tax=Parvicella tangerina TaxID=2829795 RepID=A0A916NT46_9FLAO|nr:protein translocase subunit SecD [Parvicella tangerina]CAG5085262.1 Protein translocase subunit SecD [Parvicella tangerina]